MFVHTRLIFFLAFFLGRGAIDKNRVQRENNDKHAETQQQVKQV